jgi:hypothetical protein
MFITKEKDTDKHQPVAQPVEPWFVSACSVDFGTRVDEWIGGGSGELDNFHLFSVAQSAGGLAEGFDHQNWVSLPQNVAFDEVPL